MRRFRLLGILILTSLLTVVYTLTSAGRFHIVDETSLFAVTESVALRRDVDTNAIAWTQWVNSPGEVLGAFGPDGEVYSKKGPAPAFVAVPWYLLLRFISQLNVALGQLQGTLLWNGIVTAWTAALLWLTAVRLGFRDRTGMELGLLFGLATIAWPYANLFFGEPLSAAALLLTFYGLLSWRASGRWVWMALAGVGAGLTLATVTAHVVLLALLGAWFLADWVVQWRRSVKAPGVEQLLWGLIAFVVPVLVTGALLLWYNYARFGDPFATGYHFDSGEGFTTPIWQGLWGQLFSPYRSVFLHTPLFILSAVAYFWFLRRRRSPAIAIGVMSLVLVLLYSTWWMWWGGFSWGPRFLVPLTPLWVLVLAPFVEPVGTGDKVAPDPAPRRRRRVHLAPAQWLVVGFGLVSFVVQLAAVSVNFVNYETILRDIYPTDWGDPLVFGPPAQGIADLFASPVFGQFKLMAQNFVVNTDLAWLWADGTVRWLPVIIGVAAIVTLGIMLWFWWRMAAQRTTQSISLPTAILVLILPLLVMAAWLGETGAEPGYGTEDTGYRAILASICQTATETDAFVNVAPTSYQIPMNWLPGACRVSLPTYGYATDSLNHPETEQVLQRISDTHDRIWFVTSGVQPNDPDNSLERWLGFNAFKAIDTWYDDYRLVQYATPVRLGGAEAQPINEALFGKQAEQVTVLSARAPSVAPAGKPIPVEISYRLEAPTTQNLRWFVQLLSGQNIPLAQLDTAPDDNYTSFNTLPARETLVEKAGLLVPENMPEGDYLLIAGLYNPDAEGARLVTVGGTDFVSLGSVRVIKTE
jgi:hypothetical protein